MKRSNDRGKQGFGFEGNFGKFSAGYLVRQDAESYRVGRAVSARRVARLQSRTGLRIPAPGCEDCVKLEIKNRLQHHPLRGCGPNSSPVFSGLLVPRNPELCAEIPLGFEELR